MRGDAHLPSAARSRPFADALTAIRQDSDRLRVLIGLAPHLLDMPPEPAAEALTLTRGFGAELQALTAMLPRVPAGVTRAGGNRDPRRGDGHQIARTLAGLAPHLTEADRGRALTDALTAATRARNPAAGGTP